MVQFKECIVCQGTMSSSKSVKCVMEPWSSSESVNVSGNHGLVQRVSGNHRPVQIVSWNHGAVQRVRGIVVQLKMCQESLSSGKCFRE